MDVTRTRARRRATAMLILNGECGFDACPWWIALQQPMEGGQRNTVLAREWVLLRYLYFAELFLDETAWHTPQVCKSFSAVAARCEYKCPWRLEPQDELRTPRIFQMKDMRVGETRLRGRSLRGGILGIFWKAPSKSLF